MTFPPEAHLGDSIDLELDAEASSRSITSVMWPSESQRNMSSGAESARIRSASMPKTFSKIAANFFNARHRVDSLPVMLGHRLMGPSPSPRLKWRSSSCTPWLFEELSPSPRTRENGIGGALEEARPPEPVARRRGIGSIRSGRRLAIRECSGRRDYLDRIGGAAKQSTTRSEPDAPNCLWFRQRRARAPRPNRSSADPSDIFSG